ncbi:MAG: fasciclin domain-containing protein [Deltaproteobacteria bacterium]|nr:fasciclin domain-containing protein [Deltaproteobacteria bacterium]
MIDLNRNWTLMLALTMSLGLAGCPVEADDDDAVGDDDDSVAATDSIFDIADASDDFDTLSAALVAASLDGTMDDDAAGPFTVFAPTDDAFDALPAGLLGKLLDDTELLTSILTYHVVEGAVDAATATGLDSAGSLQGEDIAIAFDGTTVTVNGATVTMTDIEATNGIIHVIDAVIVPPSITLPVDIVDTAIGAGDFGTLVTAVQAAGLEDTLRGEGPFTVFAPTDAAFEALPAGLVGKLLDDTDTLTSILTYHVVSGAVDAATVVGLTSTGTVQGEDITIDASNGVVLNGGAVVTVTDIEASNGIIHVIDAVLVPPSITLPKDIVDTAIEAGFSELANAVTAVGLVDTLRGEGPFTVFAPTDAAFEAVASVTEGLTDQQLTEVLLYHVVSGEVDAAAVVGLTSATTVQGEDISIDASNGVVLNGNATVTTTDVEASNGIIHIIDAVILPPSFQ